MRKAQMTADPPSAAMGLRDMELYHETLMGDHEYVVIQLVSWPGDLAVRQPARLIEHYRVSQICTSPPVCVHTCVCVYDVCVQVCVYDVCVCVHV